MNLQEFMDDFMNKDDLALLTKDAGLLFDCPAMVVDMAFHAVAWHRPPGFTDAPFDASVETEALSYEAGSLLAGSDAQARYVTLEDSPYRRRFSLLVTGGVPVGYLILVDVHGRLEQENAHLFLSVESAMAKQLMLETNRGSSVQSTEESVLQHLLEGKFADEALFELQAAAAGLKYFAPRRMALVNLELYRSANWSENALRGTILDYFPQSRPMMHDGGVVFFLNSDPDMALFNHLAERFSLRVVVSMPIDRLFHLPERYAAARELMDWLLIRREEPFAEASEPYCALMLLRRMGNQADLTLPSVAALAERDRSDDTLYCLTLYTYLICHHSLQETCARLYTHRNTVLYRVRRMREDFNIPIDDPDQHLALLLSAAQMLIALGQEERLATGAGGTLAPDRDPEGAEA